MYFSLFHSEVGKSIDFQRFCPTWVEVRVAIVFLLIVKVFHVSVNWNLASAACRLWHSSCKTMRWWGLGNQTCW